MDVKNEKEKRSKSHPTNAKSMKDPELENENFFSKQNGVEPPRVLPSKATFLGRSAKSWGQIIGFYIIFYICLAAFWLACLFIFLNTIDQYVPRYYGANTIIGANPGVGYQPWLADNPESTLIRFNEKDASSYKDYLNVIDKFLEKYNNTENTRVCDGTAANSDYVKNGKAEKQDQACRFDLGFLDEHGCGKADGFGFRKGTPCVILSLNRLINWVPEPYDNKADVPTVISSRYKSDSQSVSIPFHCDGISEADKDHIGHIDYFPHHGIHGRYYPYAKMFNYHQPFAVVKFANLPPNRVVMVECGAYAKNIKQDEQSKSGMVTFELLRQQKEG